MSDQEAVDVNSGNSLAAVHSSVVPVPPPSTTAGIVVDANGFREAVRLLEGDVAQESVVVGLHRPTDVTVIVDRLHVYYYGRAIIVAGGEEGGGGGGGPGEVVAGADNEAAAAAAVEQQQQAEDGREPVVDEQVQGPEAAAAAANDAANHDDDGDAAFFPRFVELLNSSGRQYEEEVAVDDGTGTGTGRTTRKRKVVVRGISFHGDWTKLFLHGHQEGVEHLFRTVLPNHRSIQNIYINVAQFPSQFVRTLTENIPAVITTAATAIATGRCTGAAAARESTSTTTTTSLRIGTGGSLTTMDGHSQGEVVQALVDMLRRNAAVNALQVDVRLESDQCQRLCQALPHSTCLRGLYVSVAQVQAGTLDGLGASKSLRRLEISAPFSVDGTGAECLAEQLRTNESLWVLLLATSNGARCLRDPRGTLLELVQTYNCRLRRLKGDAIDWIGPPTAGVDLRYQYQIQSYVKRNAKVRSLLRVLKSPDDSRAIVSGRGGGLVPPPVLPRLLGKVSDLPTVTYRILRITLAQYVLDVRQQRRHRQQHQHQKRQKHNH